MARNSAAVLPAGTAVRIESAVKPPAPETAAFLRGPQAPSNTNKPMTPMLILPIDFLF
jgi:hypothetical protein